jgi:hypothetical protein
VSDIDIALVDSLKALDPKWPIREAEVAVLRWSKAIGLSKSQAAKALTPSHKPRCDLHSAQVSSRRQSVDRLSHSCRHQAP